MPTEKEAMLKSLSEPAKKQDHAYNQAMAQVESIAEMVAALHDATKKQEKSKVVITDAYDNAVQTIQEDALSVEVRSDWHTPGNGGRGETPAGEYTILLCTGGPACRVIGRLTEHGEPESAQIEYQDWGTPWTDYRLTADEENTVLEYARCFYFGE